MAVDLAAGWKQVHALLHQRGEWLAALDHHLQHEQPGNHAAVAIGEIPEVMMRAHLAAVSRIHLAHLLFDEGMAGFAQYRLPAVRTHDIDGVPGEPGIVHDARAGLALEKRSEERRVGEER